MNTVMRSNDAYLGLPYDMFQFTQLQLSLARALSVDAGWYRHTALSLHIYVDDIEAAEKIEAPTDTDDFQPQGIGHTGDNFTTTMKRARRLACGHDLEARTLSEIWYQTTLAPYVATGEQS
jgi:thymidylate synthase